MDDRRLETIIGGLLRIGVLVAAVIVFVGGALYLAGHYAEPINYRVFSLPPVEQRTVAGIVSSALHGQSTGLIQFGLLLLIATPIARVIMAVIGFALERDKLYFIVSGIVLAILVFSIMHAV